MRFTNKFVILTCLYFDQGIPFGFFMQTLPVLMRQQGYSLVAIGLTILLESPWVFKFIFAPFVDRFGGGRFGRRRTWLLPLQAVSVIVYVLCRVS